MRGASTSGLPRARSGPFPPVTAPDKRGSARRPGPDSLTPWKSANSAYESRSHMRHIGMRTRARSRNKRCRCRVRGSIRLRPIEAGDGSGRKGKGESMERELKRGASIQGRTVRGWDHASSPGKKRLSTGTYIWVLGYVGWNLLRASPESTHCVKAPVLGGEDPVG